MFDRLASRGGKPPAPDLQLRDRRRVLCHTKLLIVSHRPIASEYRCQLYLHLRSDRRGDGGIRQPVYLRAQGQIYSPVRLTGRRHRRAEIDTRPALVSFVPAEDVIQGVGFYPYFAPVRQRPQPGVVGEVRRQPCVDLLPLLLRHRKVGIVVGDGRDLADTAVFIQEHNVVADGGHRVAVHRLDLACNPYNRPVRERREQPVQTPVRTEDDKIAADGQDTHDVAALLIADVEPLRVGVGVDVDIVPASLILALPVLRVADAGVAQPVAACARQQQPSLADHYVVRGIPLVAAAGVGFVYRHGGLRHKLFPVIPLDYRAGGDEQPPLRLLAPIAVDRQISAGEGADTDGRAVHDTV